MTRYLKSLLGWLFFTTGAYRWFFRGRAFIVAFHRIQDDLPDDALTCDKEKFRAFCDFYSRYFIVVSLSDLVAKLERGDDVSRHMAITFDDGYLDNAEVAAPLLRARRLPACFFVATDFVDAGGDAPWDAEAGIRSRWMSWAHVRQLADLGFEVGAHTVHHVDLGRVEGEVAREEIAGSKRRLEEILGQRVDLFSYPFGGASQCSDENRQEIRKAGFRCCVSAYGGVVPEGADPFRLERMPVVAQWFRGPYQFGFEMMYQQHNRPWAPQQAAQPAAA